MTERYIKSPERRIFPEMVSRHPFSSVHLGLALAVAELGQEEPRQAQELAIRIVTEGLRVFLLGKIWLEVGAGVEGAVSSHLDWAAVSLSFISQPLGEEDKIRLGAFFTSIPAGQTLGPIVSEGLVALIKRLLVFHLDQPGQREFIAQMKGRFEDEKIRFNPEIGVVRTLVSLCSGYPVIETPWEEPAWSKLTGLQLIEKEIGKRFTPQEYQQALAQPFLTIQDFRAIDQVLARLHSESQLPPLYLENREVFPSVPGEEIKWADFLSEAKAKIGALFNLTVD